MEESIEEFESFTIGAQEASDILGVNRTRLSQLTSKGIFAFERRKIENRNRLFYRLNDLLNYQRQVTYGNLDAKIQFKERFLPQPAKETMVLDTLPIVISNATQAEQRPPLRTPHLRPQAAKNTLSTAVARKETVDLKNEILTLKNKLQHIELYLQEQKQLFAALEKHLKAQDLKLFQLSLPQEKKQHFTAQKKDHNDVKVTKKDSSFWNQKKSEKRFVKMGSEK